MSEISVIISRISKKPIETLKSETVLIGEGGILDSLGLVELCLQLEDYALDLGFEFDWTSDNSMSRSKSMFRTIDSLTEEFEKQRLL